MADLSSGSTGHEAGASALGFYYQAHYALLSLLRHSTDDSAVSVERLDDVELEVNGQHLLIQLKHSLSKRPPPVSLSSTALWKTIKVWIDTLPNVSLASTRFHLIAVGAIPSGSPLLSLCEENTDRRPLLMAMTEEAKRVVDRRATSSKAKLPYADRAPGCEAFLALSDSDRLNLLRQIDIFPKSPDITRIEALIGQQLKWTPVEYRTSVTKRLVEWWGLQIVHSLCGMRDRAISFTELQYMLMEIESDLVEDNLSWEFEDAMFPPGHLPHRMLERQIALVDGSKVDLKRSTRDQWRAHEQRSSWVSSNPSMKLKVARYDSRLVECWSDMHEQMVLDCEDGDEAAKRESGLKLLRWTYDEAPKNVESISTPSRHFYIRGTYQTLSIDRRVGWHPDYIKLLEGDS
ncbi:ABC-three component system protein [Pseudomonas chlororaphis]|uniref:ABC-three component system protein n=1 Tax=Pseudomonas chlororaphis TaxID=587753 RepID=UPI002407AC8C|nr:ABC-three component system protein [Pseudomonas chlororaphis]